jgi:sugar fermentation stimulation protein A
VPQPIVIILLFMILFKSPLIKATLIKRYKRFLADAILPSGEIITAYCPNTGAMDGVQTPNSTIWITKIDDPNRKLKYEWFLTELGDGTLVGVNTAIPNQLVNHFFPTFFNNESFLKEHTYIKGTRFDFYIPSQNHFIEIKNVHMKRGAMAFFPDAITERGTKHLYHLEHIAKTTHAKTTMLYIIQRKDVESMGFASWIDPDYYKAAKSAHEAGVEFKAWICDMSVDGVQPLREIPVDFNDYANQYKN